MKASETRYDKMQYRRLGTSGLKLPIISLGLWNNFGAVDNFEKCEEIIWEAFNNGITHIDLANNYGPPAGTAEETFGKVLANGLMEHRDELIISTKAGYHMWDGPYGDGGSRKYLFASLNQSLKRMGLEYVDIFYHHRPDAETDLYETMLALRDIVLSGKALYVGLSNYNSEQLKAASKILRKLRVPFVINQPSYSMLNRWTEDDKLLDTVEDINAGTICFSPLAQGLLSNKYIDSIPAESRALNENIVFLSKDNITPELREQLKALKVIADSRNQSVSQLALCWVLRDQRMTSALIGVRTLEQLQDNLSILDNLELSADEQAQIEAILNK